MARDFWTIKRRKFVQAYCGNATEAARIAGYTGSDAVIAQSGSELMQKPEIIDAIRARDPDGRKTRQQFWLNVLSDENQSEANIRYAEDLLGKSDIIEDDPTHP